MQIKLLDYENIAYEIVVNEINLDYIEVEVISGDEIISIYFKDGSFETYDASDYSHKPRMLESYGGWYDVYPEDIEEWMNRTDSYEFILKKYSNMAHESW